MLARQVLYCSNNSSNPLFFLFYSFLIAYFNWIYLFFSNFVNQSLVQIFTTSFLKGTFDHINSSSSVIWAAVNKLSFNSKYFLLSFLVYLLINWLLGNIWGAIFIIVHEYFFSNVYFLLDLFLFSICSSNILWLEKRFLWWHQFFLYCLFFFYGLKYTYT
jgi:hypothetical protein